MFRRLSAAALCVAVLGLLSGCGGAQKGRMADRDGDGIPDGRDLCPEMPEDHDGVEDDDGCPDD
jgi:hypothetical protein